MNDDRKVPGTKSHPDGVGKKRTLRRLIRREFRRLRKSGATGPHMTSFRAFWRTY